MLFCPPPRITLKLKMPKGPGVGNGNRSSKLGNGPLCPDNSGNVHEHAAEGLGQGKPQLHARCSKEERSNGRLSAPSSTLLSGKPVGKHLALHIVHPAHSSNGNGKLDQDRSCTLKCNGVLDKLAAQKDTSCQTQANRDITKEQMDKKSFCKSAMERFGRSFKEATINLVRTTEDLQASDKLSRKSFAKEKQWVKPVLEHKAKNRRSQQDSDGYCPDLEQSDSEPEAKGRLSQQVGLPQANAARKGKHSVGSRHSMQR